MTTMIPTLRSIRARPVLLKLKRPVVARIATMSDWPLILIDMETEEGITGRAYLEPYVPKAMRYLVPALDDLGDMLRGRSVAPFEFYRAARKSLHFVGYEGLAMIAAAGLDMAAWDTLPGRRTCRSAPSSAARWGRVRAYSSNGLWLREAEEVAAEAVELLAEGGFAGVKLRMGRARARDDLETHEAVRQAIGNDVTVMVDFNQGLDLAEGASALPCDRRPRIAWIEEPVLYDDFSGYAKLAGELKTPLQIGENFYGPRDMWKALSMNACDLVMPDFMRIGGVTGWLHAAGSGGRGQRADLHPSLPRGRRARDAGRRDRPLARMAGLGRPDPGTTLRGKGRRDRDPRRPRPRPRLERGRRRASPGRLAGISRQVGHSVPLGRAVDRLGEVRRPANCYT